MSEETRYGVSWYVFEAEDNRNEEVGIIKSDEAGVEHITLEEENRVDEGEDGVYVGMVQSDVFRSSPEDQSVTVHEVYMNSDGEWWTEACGDVERPERFEDEEEDE